MKDFIESILDYFFRRPSTNWSFMIPAYVISIFMIISAIFLGIYINKKLPQIEKKLLKSIPKVIVQWSILLVLVTFFRSEGIPILANRFWWIVYILGISYHSYYLFNNFNKNRDSIRNKLELKENIKTGIDPYKPRKKKK